MLNLSATATGTFFALTICGALHAQSESVIYAFKGGNDGASPASGMIYAAGTFYGTTSNGGGLGCLSDLGCGTVFKASPTGVVTVLHRFDKGSYGAHPNGELTYSEGSLYGTAYSGGGHNCGGFGCGSVFQITTTGLIKFVQDFGAGSKGGNPYGDLLKLGSRFYGTVQNGGPNIGGGIFVLSQTGAIKLLYNFNFNSSDGSGLTPGPGLVNLGGNLYGTTGQGGAIGVGAGTVFQITPAGSLTNIYAFNANDGAEAEAPMIAYKGTLYGTTARNATYYKYADGVVFSVTPSGDEQVLHYFTGGADGALPYGPLLNVGGTFYGTTMYGGGSGCSTNSNGPPGCGTIYKITPSGVESVVYAFHGNADGARPQGPLTFVNGEIYGTTSQGGGSGCQYQFNSGCGTLFKFRP